MTTPAQRRPSRQQLLSQPRSGARSLSGGGAATGVTGKQPAAVPTTASLGAPPRKYKSPRPAAPPADSSLSDTAVADRKAATQQPEQEPEQQPAASQRAPVVNVSTGGAAHQAGGAVLALFLWPLILNLVRGGTGQMWGWVKAKFVNEPYSPGGNPAPASSNTISVPSLTAAQQQQLLTSGVNGLTIAKARQAQQVQAGAG